MSDIPDELQDQFYDLQMIRPHVIFFKMAVSQFGVLRANPIQKYPKWLFEYYFHLPQHTSARAAFQCLYTSKRKHEIEGLKLKMI